MDSREENVFTSIYSVVNSKTRTFSRTQASLLDLPLPSSTIEMLKKRKLDIAEVDYPRITYDAATRTFDRLFKEDSLEEMKGVVRKKFGVSDSVPIFLSQIREGKLVDLEDDDDFEAFTTAARASQVVSVKVVLGDHPTASQNGNSTPISSSKRRKKKNLDVTATSSTTNVNSIDGELSAPRQKKRRVSFAELSTERPKNLFEQESSFQKKATLAVAGSSAQSIHHSLADAINTALNGVGSTSVSAASGAPGVKEKKREVAVAEGPRLVNNTTQSAIGAAGTAATTPVTEIPAATRLKKRSRSDVAIEDQLPESPTFTNSASMSKEVDAPQPKKTSRKRQKETPDDLPTKSRSIAVSLSSIAQAPTTGTLATSSPIDVQAKILPAKTKETPAAPEEIETSQIKKIKKSVKPTAVGKPSSREPSGTKTVGSNVKGKKQAISSEKHSDDTSVPTTGTTLKAKRPGKAKANVTTSDPQEVQTSPSDVPTDRDKQNTSAIQAEAPKRKGRKSEAAGNGPESGTELGKSQGNGDTPQDSTNREDLRAATLAAVYTVLTRKGITPGAQSFIPSVASPSLTNPPTATEKKRGSPEALSVCFICNESPNHERTVCPVIKGGVRAMRKRVVQLEKDTSGNETNQEVIDELQAMISKRSRGPRKANVVGSTDKKKVTTTDHDAQKGQKVARAAAVKSAEPVKQVDVVVSPARVVDAVPPAPPPQPLQSTLPTVRQPQLSSSQPLLRRSQPSSSSQKTTQVMEKAPIEKVIHTDVPNPFNLKDLSRFTDMDLENYVYGPKMSIDDVQSSNEEEEEEEEEEEVVSDEDEEPNNRRLGQKTSQAHYPSSSEKEDEDEDEDSGTGSSTKSVAPSQPLIAMDDQPNGTDTPGDLSLGLGGNTSFREVDTRGSSRELDRSANDAADDALAGDLSSFHVALRLEQDSDTVVASQNEEFAGRLSTKTAENVAADVPSLDPIEPSEPPIGGHMEADQIEPIASDVGGPEFPKVNLLIRRSQRNKASVDKSDDFEEVPATQEDIQIVERRKSSRTGSMKKITALPVPPNPSVRVIKPKPRTATPHVQNGVGVGEEKQENVAGEEEDSEPLKETAKRGKPVPKSNAKNTTTKEKAASKAATSKGKKTPARATRSQAPVTPKTPKLRRSVKITPLEPIPGGRTTSEVIDDSTVSGSQWVVLPESEPSQPGQIDELFSDPVPDSQVADKGSSQRAMVNGSSPSRDPLFLPSETQESFSYSQHPSVIFGSQGRNRTQNLSPHDSEDEEEVLASVTKVKTRFRSLSQIANSQFSTPKYFSGNVKIPELDLYGNRNRKEEPEESESDGSEDDDEPPNSHIPATRRAGSQKK